MPHAQTSADSASKGFTRSPSMLAVGRAEAYAFAKQAWRMGKRAYQLRRFANFWRAQQERLRRSTEEQLRAEQLIQLRRMLTHAGEKIPHYREVFDEAGFDVGGLRDAGLNNADELRRLPLLTRETIRRNFPDRLVHPERSFRTWMLGRTSGSTSESLSFIRPDDRFRRSLYYSVLMRTGGRTDVQLFVLSTPICTPNTCSLTPQEDEHRHLARRLHRVPPIRHYGGMIGLPSSAENILTADDALFEEIRRQLEDGAPSILIADPVYLGAFARYLRRKGLEAPEIRAVISTYELLTPSVQDLLEDVFGCEVTTQYGSSEINDIADTCENGRLHVRMDEVLVELLRDGRPAEPGELARVVVTDLRNFNMPFIRYDIGDVVRVEEGPCECGRRSQLLGEIQGRASDVFELGDRLVTPLEADALFRDLHDDLVAYELVKTGSAAGSSGGTSGGKGRCKIALMAESELELEKLGPRIEERAAALLGDVSLRLRQVEEIRPQASNKFRFVYAKRGDEPVRP